MDDSHKERSISRHDGLKDCLDLLKQGIGSLSAVIGGVSAIVSLVQGAVKLVVDVSLLHLTSGFHMAY